MLWVYCLTHFVPFIDFSFLNDIIILFGNLTINEINKTKYPTSKSISCRNTNLEFSVFTMACPTVLLFLINWIKFLSESSLLSNELFCYYNSEVNRWLLEEVTILHLHYTYCLYKLHSSYLWIVLLNLQLLLDFVDDIIHQYMLDIPFFKSIC